MRVDRKVLLMLAYSHERGRVSIPREGYLNSFWNESDQPGWVTNRPDVRAPEPLAVE
jgi:hypothetical protein